MRRYPGNQYPYGWLITVQLLLAVVAVSGPILPTLAAEAPAQTYSFDIPAGDIIASLEKLAEASGIQLVYDKAALQGRKAPALKGQFSVDKALVVVLKDSGATWKRVSPTSIVIQPASSSGTGKLRSAAAAAADEGVAADISVQSQLAKEKYDPVQNADLVR